MPSLENTELLRTLATIKNTGRGKDCVVAYGKALFDSCKEAWHSPKFLLAFLLQAIAVIVLVLVFLLVGLLVFFAVSGTGMQDLEASVESLPAQLLTPSVFIPLFVVILVGVLLIWIIALWFSAGILGMANEIVQGRKATYESFVGTAKERFGPLLRLSMLKMALFFLAAVPILIGIGLLFVAGVSKVVAILLLIFFAIISLVAFFLLAIAFFFAETALIQDKLDARPALSKSIMLLRECTGHVFASFFIMVGVIVGVGIALMIITMPVQLGAEITKHPLLVGANAVLNIVEMFVQFFVGVVVLLFTFRMYCVAQAPNQAPARLQASRGQKQKARAGALRRAPRASGRQASRKQSGQR